MIARDSNHYFRIESVELVARLEAGLLGGPTDLRMLDDLFRSAHTLKGAARSVERHFVADLAHSMEDVLAHHRETGERLSPIETQELLALLDAVRRELAKSEDPTPIDEGARGPTRRATGVRVEPEDMDALSGGIAEVETHGRELRRTARTALELRALAMKLSAIAASAGSESGVPARLRAGLDELTSTLADHARALRDSTDRLDVEVRQVSQRAFELRLVALAEMLPELERTVHDAARATGKLVTFEPLGMDIRIDVRILAELRGALVHLVRNAIAHGLEDRETRRQFHKSETGRVTIRVERRGGRIALVVSDDGRGLDRSAIVESALVRGLVADEDEGYRRIDELIFHPGLSTARTVSDLAGRGVGLDAVGAMLDTCSGTVRVRSTEGVGTTFEIELPLSLSATRALVVEADDSVVLVPIDFVIATRRITESDILTSGTRPTIIHDGSSIPFRTLAELVGTEGDAESPRIVVVVRTSTGPVGLGASVLRGTRDVVQRPLPAAVLRSRRFSGASIDQGGVPRLVLDPEGLVGASSNTFVRRTAATRGEPVLVIDDSLTTRMLEQSILEAVGYEVDVASSAEEGLTMASRRRYSLFVCDVEMPGMNGYEFTRETRSRPELAKTPVIMVTSLDSAESRKKGADAGVSTYIVKSEFDQTAFLRAVAELRT